MDEMRLRRDAERGPRAEALLSNELLKEAFDKIELTLMDEWKNTTSEDSQRREDAWRSFKLLKGLQGYLRKVVTTGDAAAKELLKVKNPSIIERFK
jgi:hypothetical protein